ncbi:MAG TPA: 2-oxoacid:acceptor oxidoreductase family protein [Dehalococcoidia bacterium]|jgi:2-oxoglutarate ferredoxin oxidoreductase subunit gamma|nr:2-oxoacid:acceptor oxidoreductase family protein [Dehalococcoidia bacterium]
MRTEIRFAGIGGQGSVLASTILAEAAGVAAGFEAVQTQFYEAAIRDGAAAGDIVIGDEPITFPWVLAPDYLIAQHQGAIRAHLDSVKPDAVVIADTVYVREIPETTATVYHVPLTEIADGVGIRRVANMVALATFAKASGLISYEDLESAVLKRSPGDSGTINTQALREGYDLNLDEHLVGAVAAVS